MFRLDWFPYRNNYTLQEYTSDLILFCCLSYYLRAHNRQGVYKVIDNFLIPSFTGQIQIK